MNEKIANILKSQIELLPFIDKIAGLVRPLKVEVPGPNNTKVLKTYPIASDVTSEACISGAYKNLIPDSKYKSIIYFEDAGITMTYREKRWVSFTSRLTLVCWLNLSKLMDCDYHTGSTEAILSIMANLPEGVIQSGVYREIRITSISEVVKSNAIFGRYTYDEIKTQYLLYPFDFFALNMVVDFRINLSCVEEFKLGLCGCPKKLYTEIDTPTGYEPILTENNNPILV
jgi:hypothetical protein